MFNKQGQRENPSTLAEQINKALDEKIKQFDRNELFNEGNKTTPKRKINYTNIFNEPLQETCLGNIQQVQPVINAPSTYMKQTEPETLEKIIKSQPLKNKDSEIYKPKEKQNTNTNNNMSVNEIPVQFQPQQKNQLNNLQLVILEEICHQRQYLKQ